MRFERKNLYTYVDVVRMVGSPDRLMVTATERIDSAPSQFDVVHAWVSDWIIRGKCTNTVTQTSRIYLVDEQFNNCEVNNCPIRFISILEKYATSRRTTGQSWPLPSSLVALILIDCTAANFPCHPNILRPILS